MIINNIAAQVKEYKADVAKLRESAQAAAASTPGGAAARAELGLMDDYSQTSSGQRERLLQTTEKLGRTGERITQGRQQLLETEVRAQPQHSGVFFYPYVVVVLVLDPPRRCMLPRGGASWALAH